MTWTKDQLLDYVEGVLRRAAEAAPPHHFEPPYMTVHQLAIEISREAGATDKHVGGRGTGVGSLAEYLGRLLSGEIKHHPRRRRIKGAWLSPRNIENLKFDGDVDPTRMDSAQGMSMYRYRVEDLQD